MQYAVGRICPVYTGNRKKVYMDIAGKIAIITGASSGIGLATARLFTQHGAKVALAARSVAKLQTVAAELPGSFVVPTDMRDTNAVHQMITAVHQHYGRIDILINNAGQGMHVPIAQANLDDYRAIFELNVVSVIAAIQGVIPIMRQQGGGVIINISSGLSKMILPGVGPYASSKYALNAITLTARQELATDQIQVGLVIPGLTATNFAENSIRLPTPPAAAQERRGPMTIESAEAVAAKILEAVQSGAAEVYADSIKARMQQQGS